MNIKNEKSNNFFDIFNPPNSKEIDARYVSPDVFGLDFDLNTTQTNKDDNTQNIYFSTNNNLYNPSNEEKTINPENNNFGSDIANIENHNQDISKKFQESRYTLHSTQTDLNNFDIISDDDTSTYNPYKNITDEGIPLSPYLEDLEGVNFEQYEQRTEQPINTSNDKKRSRTEEIEEMKLPSKKRNISPVTEIINLNLKNNKFILPNILSKNNFDQTPTKNSKHSDIPFPSNTSKLVVKNNKLNREMAEWKEIETFTKCIQENTEPKGPKFFKTNWLKIHKEMTKINFLRERTDKNDLKTIKSICSRKIERINKQLEIFPVDRSYKSKTEYFERLLKRIAGILDNSLPLPKKVPLNRLTYKEKLVIVKSIKSNLNLINESYFEIDWKSVLKNLREAGKNEKHIDYQTCQNFFRNIGPQLKISPPKVKERTYESMTTYINKLISKLEKLSENKSSTDQESTINSSEKIKNVDLTSKIDFNNNINVITSPNILSNVNFNEFETFNDTLSGNYLKSVDVVESSIEEGKNSRFDNRSIKITDFSFATQEMNSNTNN